jgi:hypothetical protein
VRFFCADDEAVSKYEVEGGNLTDWTEVAEIIAKDSNNELCAQLSRLVDRHHARPVRQSTQVDTVHELFPIVSSRIRASESTGYISGGQALLSSIALLQPTHSIESINVSCPDRHFELYLSHTMPSILLGCVRVLHGESAHPALSALAGRAFVSFAEDGQAWLARLTDGFTISGPTLRSCDVIGNELQEYRALKPGELIGRRISRVFESRFESEMLLGHELALLTSRLVVDTPKGGLVYESFVSDEAGFV